MRTAIGILAFSMAALIANSKATSNTPLHNVASENDLKTAYGADGNSPQSGEIICADFNLQGEQVSQATCVYEGEIMDGQPCIQCGDDGTYEHMYEAVFSPTGTGEPGYLDTDTTPCSNLMREVGECTEIVFVGGSHWLCVPSADQPIESCSGDIISWNYQTD